MIMATKKKMTHSLSTLIEIAAIVRAVVVVATVVDLTEVSNAKVE